MSSSIVVSFAKYVPRVAIVTGASRGLGRAIVHRLADDGIDVAINDIATERNNMDKVVEEVNQKGRRAIAIPGDVSHEPDVVAMVERTAKELGSVDIMIANAGIFPPTPLVETSLETFKKVTDINIHGVFLCFKYAAVQMIKQGCGGRLIVASSTAGKKGPPGLSAYAASKFAVRGIVQSACVELQPYGITVNGYAPGLIVHPGLTQTFSEQELSGMASQVATGKPEDVASAVSYLCKPESYFINGQTINIAGPGNVYD